MIVYGPLSNPQAMGIQGSYLSQHLQAHVANQTGVLQHGGYYGPTGVGGMGSMGGLGVAGSLGARAGAYGLGMGAFGQTAGGLPTGAPMGPLGPISAQGYESTLLEAHADIANLHSYAYFLLISSPFYTARSSCTDRLVNLSLYRQTCESLLVHTWKQGHRVMIIPLGPFHSPVVLKDEYQ